MTKIIIFLTLSIAAFCLLDNPEGLQDNWGYTQDTYIAKVDNFNFTDQRTFRLRYWYNMDGADLKNTKTPIFVYICGEYVC
jgi:Serine carboxypeptidase S28